MIEAGCKEKLWKLDKGGLASEYQWTAQNGSTLLAKGVCIEDGYQRHFVPEKGITKVHSTIEYQELRKVDAKEQTVSMDFTLTLKWLDPHVRTTEERLKNEEILLSPTSIEMLWTPGLHIRNRTNEEISMISSRIISADERNELDKLIKHMGAKMEEYIKHHFK